MILSVLSYISKELVRPIARDFDHISAQGFCFSHVPTIKWFLGPSCGQSNREWETSVRNRGSSGQIMRNHGMGSTQPLRKSILYLVLANLGNAYYLATIFMRLVLWLNVVKKKCLRTHLFNNAFRVLYGSFVSFVYIYIY